MHAHRAPWRPVSRLNFLLFGLILEPFFLAEKRKVRLLAKNLETFLMQPFSILETLYITTQGPLWRLKADWLTDIEPCSWYGISCTNQMITSMRLNENHLAGSIPSQLGLLSHLHSYVIYHFRHPFWGHELSGLRLSETIYPHNYSSLQVFQT